jgi:hypothetical protein
MADNSVPQKMEIAATIQAASPIQKVRTWNL